MSKVRVAVIGCGAIAQRRHIPEYASNPAVELVAFCDIVHDRAQFYANQYNGVAYTNYEDLLASEEIDAVSVCLPNYLHAAVAIAAAQSGAHVLCEKPMATSTSEGKAMIQAAREKGVHLMIGHNQRLMPPHVKAKEILRREDVGKVISFRTTFGHRGPEVWSVDGRDSWFFNKQQASMGAMGDLGVHKADLMRYLLDDEIVEVGGFVEGLVKRNSDVDDNAVCIIRTRSGVLGTLAASWSYQKEDNSTILYCENGVVRINDNSEYQIVVQLSNGSVEKYQVGVVATNDRQVSSGVIDAFITSIQLHSPPLISGEEGLESLKVVLAILKSAAEGTVVAVE